MISRQQAGNSPATTARGKPDPSPLTGTDWLSNESSLEANTFTAASGQPGAAGKYRENRNAKNFLERSFLADRAPARSA